MWDISRVRVRGLDGQEVGHVCGTYLGLEVYGIEVGHVCGTYLGLEV